MDAYKKITVTSPLLPPLEEFVPYLKEIWKSKWITNNGQFHQQLEAALCEYLDVKYLSLFTNGTLPLISAFQALNIKGEVITTPYSFAATTHSLCWNNLTPVFVDVDEKTGNISPDKIEAAVTSKTTAILAVHVYGNPCDVESIKKTADRYGLKVVYDAAHAFGVREKGESILKAGDMSTLSFHATKTYNTVEGGALICHDEETKQRIDHLKNFGFTDETHIEAVGMNGKMDEIRSAFGLINLKYVDEAIESRHRVSEKYRKALENVAGISFFEERQDVRYNYSYFPVFINADEYGMSRDDLYEKLKEKNILARRYFYPSISDFSVYKQLVSASPENLPSARRMADEVICLPMHHLLSDQDIDRVLETVLN